MNPIVTAVAKIKERWKDPAMDSLPAIHEIMRSLAEDQSILTLLPPEALKAANGLELHRDKDHGFVLLAYTEPQDTYRIPHDHGAAWVIYAVVTGEVEMGNYFGFSPGRLVLKQRENLRAADTRVYYPGEIHDTLCVSSSAVILRLTSADLREEERLGRMHRYPR